MLLIFLYNSLLLLKPYSKFPLSFLNEIEFPLITSMLPLFKYLKFNSPLNVVLFNTSISLQIKLSTFKTSLNNISDTLFIFSKKEILFVVKFSFLTSFC